MNQPVEVAIAILYQNQRFLCQLRDNKPGILYPGYWGLFGGHLEPGEQPETALRRELAEEINYVPDQVTLFQQHSDARVVRHVYYAPLTVPVTQLMLNEGWDMGLLTIDEIRWGECYSAQAKQIRPLGTPHQRILLDFIDRVLPQVSLAAQDI